MYSRLFLICAMTVTTLSEAAPRVALLARAKDAAAAGDHGTAYAAYRAALIYEIPKSDPRAADVRTRMTAELSAWLDSKLAAGDSAIAAGNMGDAIAIARSMLGDPSLGDYYWSHEGTDLPAPAIDAAHRDLARALALRAATAGWAKVDVLVAEHHYADAARNGEQLTLTLDEEHPLRQRLAAIIVEGVQAHEKLGAAAVSAGARRYHERTASAIRGEGGGYQDVTSPEAWNVTASAAA